MFLRDSTATTSYPYLSLVNDKISENFKVPKLKWIHDLNRHKALVLNNIIEKPISTTQINAVISDLCDLNITFETKDISLWVYVYRPSSLSPPQHRQGVETPTITNHQVGKT